MRVVLEDQETLSREVRGVTPGAALLVWLRLNAEAMRRGGMELAAAYGEIRKFTGLNYTTIATALRELERLGFIAATRRGGSGRGPRQSTSYTLLRGGYVTNTASASRPTEAVARPTEAVARPTEAVAVTRSTEAVARPTVSVLPKRECILNTPDHNFPLPPSLSPLPPPAPPESTGAGGNGPDAVTDTFQRIVRALARFGSPELPAELVKAARAMADSDLTADPDFEAVLGQLESPDAYPTAGEAAAAMLANVDTPATAGGPGRPEGATAPAADPEPAPQTPQPERPPQPEPAASGPARRAPAGKAAFTPPTVGEVAAYCTERGNRVDPEQFVAFYQSKAWVVGRKPMRDWQGAVRTWERSDGQGPQKRPAGKRPAPRAPAATPFLPRQPAAPCQPAAGTETAQGDADREGARRAAAAGFASAGPQSVPPPESAEPGPEGTPAGGPGPDGVWRDARGVRLAFESEAFARAWASRLDRPGQFPLSAWDRARLALTLRDNDLPEKQAIEAVSLLTIEPGRVGPLRHPDVEIRPLARGDAAANEKAVRDWIEAD